MYPALKPHSCPKGRLRLVLSIVVLISFAGCGGSSSNQSTFGAPAPSVDPVDRWTADNTLTDSVGSANAVAEGGVTFATGVSGQAFKFDGTNQYVEIQNTAALNPHAGTDKMSVGGWFYIDPDATGNKGDLSMLVSKSNGNTVGGGWFLAYDDRSVPAGFPASATPFARSIWFAASNTDGVYSGTTVVVRLDNAINSAGWYHIIVTFDPSATPEAILYINGRAVANSGLQHIPFITNNALTARIGAAHTNEFGGVDNDRFNGLADDVRFYDRALTANDVRLLFNALAANAGLPPI